MVKSMFEVTTYEHPLIFVMSRRTGETYRFLVGKDNTLVNEGMLFDHVDARRTAIAYLSRQKLRTELRALLSA
jgi:ABC-type phosphate/phosphonate transport system substrate-binding protein